MNEPARRFLADSRVARIERRTLAFRSRRCQAEITHFVSGGQLRTSYTTRLGTHGPTVWATPTGTNGAANHLLIRVCAADPIDQYDRLLRTQFGLTPAERDIALAIFAGSLLVNIAKQRHASVNTVKTPARHIFQKCQVHSQVSLVRKIGEFLRS